MQIIKTKFNQNAYLQPGEAGVCNALVLDWLAGNGQELKMGRGGVLARARNSKAAGVNTQTIHDYGLKIHKRTDIYKGGNLPQLHAIKDSLLRSPCHKFLIGYDGGGIGHAIGMIKDPITHKGFDPNNGYYRILGDDKMEWLFNKIFGAHVKHGYSQFLVYELH